MVLSGSWDGHVRAWKVSADKKRIEALGVVGLATPNSNAPQEATPLMNGFSHAGPDSSLSPDTNVPHHHSNNLHSPQETLMPIARGVINDISVFERGERGRDGVCIVVAVGKEHRLGRWARVQGGKNGALVLEVPRVGGRVNGVKEAANGISKGEGEEE